ncbi:hypothetical protein ACET65_19820 [Aeromonas rivipollensis]
MSNYTAAELAGALKQAEANGDTEMAHIIRGKITEQNPGRGKVPNMDAYLDRCVARCRPKGAK